MSMPKLPEINPDITYDTALNMILASIAMEEMALSRIIDAEGEKIEQILKSMCGCGGYYAAEEILAVNQSVTNMLDSISQNQIILKNKMDSVLRAQSEMNAHPPCQMMMPCPPYPPCPPPCPPKPPCPAPCPPKPPYIPGTPCPQGFLDNQAGRCSAVFKAAPQCGLWNADTCLTWVFDKLPGSCAGIDASDKTRIKLLKKGRYEVSFAVNIKAKSDCRHSAAVSLQTTVNHRREDIYTVYSAAPREGEPVTVSLSGIIVEVTAQNTPLPLSLKLVSPDVLNVECGMLSIVEL